MPSFISIIVAAVTIMALSDSVSASSVEHYHASGMVKRMADTEPRVVLCGERLLLAIRLVCNMSRRKKRSIGYELANDDEFDEQKQEHYSLYEAVFGSGERRKAALDFLKAHDDEEGQWGYHSKGRLGAMSILKVRPKTVELVFIFLNHRRFVCNETAFRVLKGTFNVRPMTTFMRMKCHCLRIT